MKSKGFKWGGFLQANTVDENQMYDCYAGGIKWTELQLSTKVKLDSMKKFKKILNGFTPDRIVITREQYQQYASLFPSEILPTNNTGIALKFEGIPIFVNL